MVAKPNAKEKNLKKTPAKELLIKQSVYSWLVCQSQSM